MIRIFLGLLMASSKDWPHHSQGLVQTENVRPLVQITMKSFQMVTAEQQTKFGTLPRPGVPEDSLGVRLRSRTCLCLLLP